MAEKDADKLKQSRQKALEIAVSQIEREFGKGAIMRLGPEFKVNIPAIPTGALSLDMALGVGGVPRGRVVEIFGPESSGKTTLSLSIISQAQRQGGVAAFIDAEHAFDSDYARKLGVNLDDLLVSQPDTGEQALQIAEMLIQSNSVDVVVIDSVAALVPRAELEGEMGDAHVGLQARLMSQALRKLTAVISKSKTSVIFINQIREKIGVMFGCFQYNTPVVLASGRKVKIGKIVNNKLPVEILSYDLKQKRIVPARIIDWHVNGQTDKFLQFVVSKNKGRGRSEFACTPDHLLLGERGWQKAKAFQVGDRLMTAVTSVLSAGHWEIVKGSLLGDGSLRRVGDWNTQLRVGHGVRQDGYVKWKQSLFKHLVRYAGRNSKRGWSFDTIPLYELTLFQETNYGQHGKNPHPAMIESLTPLAVAIWYMDDGTVDVSYGHRRCSIACKAFSSEIRELLARKLKTWGIQPHLNGNGRIDLGVRATAKFHELIAPYVHPSMAYKLLPEYRGRFQEFTVEPLIRREVVPLPITAIYEKPRTRSMRRFDIEVEGAHTYLVDDVVVHNSPETTPGGRALKFYASVRLDIRRVGTIKKGEGQVVGSRVRVKVVKNKVAPPFKQAEFDILYDEGISRSASILEAAEEAGVVQKQGTWLSFGEERIGQGKENARLFLKENPKILEAIEKKLREQLTSIAP